MPFAQYQNDFLFFCSTSVLTETLTVREKLLEIRNSFQNLNCPPSSDILVAFSKLYTMPVGEVELYTMLVGILC